MAVSDDVLKLQQDVRSLKRSMTALQRRVDALEDGGIDEEDAQLALKDEDRQEARRPEPKEERRSVAAASSRAKETSKPIENLGFKVFGGVGFVLILLGLFYFYQYAVDKGWIGHLGRIVLGVLFSLAIIFTGEVARQRKYERFAQLMTGGGLALLYFVVYATYHFREYREALHVSLGVNTALLFIVILLGVWVSLRQQSQLLTVFAFALGYLTSFLSGGTHQMMISTILLTAGFMYLDQRAGWNTPAFPVSATYLLYTIFFFTHQPEHIRLFAYLLVIGTLFAWSAFRIKSGSIAIIAASATATLGFGLTLVWQHWHAMRGVFVLALAVAYGALALVAHRKGSEQLTFTAALIAVVLVTISVPVQLDGRWFAIAWAAEALILVAAGQKYGVPRAWIIGCVIAAISGYRAVSYDLVFLDFGPRTIGLLAGIAALGGTAYLLRNEKNPARAAFGIAALALTTVSLAVEILDKKGLFAAIGDDGRFTLLLVVLCIETWVLFSGGSRFGAFARVPSYLLTGIVMLAALTWNAASADFGPRTFNYLIVLISTAAAIGWLRGRVSDSERIAVQGMALGAVVLLVVASAIEAIDPHGAFSYLSSNGRQVALSIIWAAEAILLVITYFAARVSPLQVSGVALFGITVMKILFIDLDNMETIYRVVVTLVVGMIALGASFVYVRNKDRISALLKDEKRK